jgi:hypothetical protein
MTARRRRGAWVALLSLAGLGGFVILALHGSDPLEALGGVLLGGALLVLVGLILLRLGPESLPDREREARARDEFERTGEWPAS